MNKQDRINIGYMRLLVAILKGVLALLTLTASSVFAAIGETPQQMENRQPDYVTKESGGTTMQWVGKTVTHVGYFLAGRAAVETFWFNDHHPMTSPEIERFLKPYARFRRDQVIVGDDKLTLGFNLIGIDGKYYAVVIYDKKDHTLGIVRSDVFVAAANGVYDRPASQPTLQPTDMKKDCMVTATENLHRLAANAPWSNILMFDIVANGQELPLGHAVAVWKITADGSVFAVDDNGTVELITTSSNVNDIAIALGRQYSAVEGMPIKLINGRFAVEKHY
jgi:hypothetical protein